MANTTLGFPYPAATDPPAGHTQIQALAAAVDLQPGVGSFTQAQITAFTAGEKRAGRIVWNSTTGTLQRCDGSAFVDVVLLSGAQTLANKTLTTPTIASMVNANHDHSAGAGGGLIPESSVTNLVSDLAAKAPTASPDFTTDINVTGPAPVITMFDNSVADAYTQLSGSDGILGLYSDPSNAVIDSRIEMWVDATLRMSVAASGLVTGTGTSLGAWTTYTPATSGLTLGAGTIVAKYCRIGKTVHVTGTFTLGSGSAIGMDPNIASPFAEGTPASQGFARYVDTSTSTHYAGWIRAGYFGYNATLYGGIGATVPFTWASGDVIYWSYTFETTVA